MPIELTTAIIGGVIGGMLGVIGTLISSYYGPRGFEKWKEDRKERKEFGPRKDLLLAMLENDKFPDGRKIKTLCRVTGTKPEECRRLLIEIKARGVLLKDDEEGWALISKKPLNKQ